MSKKLLLHACCAPCSSGVLPQLEKWEITLLFYNPNIDTLEEWGKRADAMSKYVKEYNKECKRNIELIVVPYNHQEFLKGTSGLEREREGGKRCDYCIASRLDYTAKYARDNNYDTFASTLSVSPHKDYNTINSIGSLLADKYGVEYLPSNFKKNNGFLMSIRNSEKYKLYRQGYCGCEFALAIQRASSKDSLPITNG